MADNPVTWGDLIKIVLFLLGAGVLFYLLLAIAHLVGILRNINKMIDSNREHISDSIEKLPEITENVAKVSNIVKDEMESIQKVMGNIGKISDSAKDAVEIIKKDIVVKAKNLLDIIDWIRKLFQDRSGKKKEVVYQYKYKPAETVEEEVIYPEDGPDTVTKDQEEKEKSEPQPDKEKRDCEGNGQGEEI